jgi:thioredoxin-related protein
MFVVIFSKTSVRNISHSKKNWARSDQKYLVVFIQSTHRFCQILVKLGFSQQIFEKYSHKHFMKIRLVGAELFRADRRADGGHGKANNRSSQFCERA